MKNVILTVMLCALFVGCTADINQPIQDAGVDDSSFTINGFVHNFEGCTNDVDCANGGETCGTMVCSWANPAIHYCVPVSTGDPGWCGDPNLDQATANTTCKCYVEGATCNIVTNFCSFVSLGDH